MLRRQISYNVILNFLSISMKSLLLVLLAISVGCQTTNIVTMTVVEPAPVELPSYIKRVGIINRSLSSDKDKMLDKVDKVLSAEGMNLDKEGAEETLRGLREELQRNNKLVEVVLLDADQVENPSFGTFPNPLSWDKVSDICAKNKLDGLFLLEFYDTDAKVAYSTKQVNIATPVGLSIPGLEHHASVNTIIKTGWRIYDGSGKNIIDEYLMTEHVTTVGRGINPVEAISAITGRKEAVKGISYQIGQSYALNIIPYKIRVSRDYYVKGTDNFKVAKRKAQTGNWDGAAELWLKETENAKAKVAGRAAYNMAIINEINGHLDMAIEWAKKAYENYDDKLGLRYVKILENRKFKAQAVERQL